VTKLEDRYRHHPGLNLTYETREGMIKHETEYDRSDAAEYEPEKRASLEAQIANLADEIAYNAHDLEDGLRASLFFPNDLDGLEIWQMLQEQIGWSDQSFDAITQREIIRELIGIMIKDVLATAAANLVDRQIDSFEKLQQQETNVVGYSAGLSGPIRALKDFLYERMYRHHRLMRMQSKAERVIDEMFNAYVKEPRMLPAKVKDLMSVTSPERVIADYIAGMTDRYAMEEWEKLFDPYRRA
jgi:dGTPase